MKRKATMSIAVITLFVALVISLQVHTQTAAPGTLKANESALIRVTNQPGEGGSAVPEQFSEDGPNPSSTGAAKTDSSLLPNLQYLDLGFNPDSVLSPTLSRAAISCMARGVTTAGRGCIALGRGYIQCCPGSKPYFWGYPPAIQCGCF